MSKIDAKKYLCAEYDIMSQIADFYNNILPC